METARLWYLLEPSCLAMVATATAVVYCSARWAVQHEIRRSSPSWSSSDQMLADASVTLDGFQAVLMPLAFSVSLLLMFYLFSFIQPLVTVLTAAAAVSSLAFCIAPLVPSRNGAGPVVIALLTGVAWIVSASWLLNDVLGMSLCVAFVTHVRLPNVRVCVLLLSCLFVYDVFWVFVSERLFGSNVMVSVATQQASNPVHTVATKLSLPLAGAIAEQLDLPVKILIPRHLLTTGGTEFMMLGLGDMAVPGMLLALVFGFDQRKQQQQQHRRRYTWIVLLGYVLGLVLALAAGLVSRLAQPALLYLVPSTLIPVISAAWSRGELAELWSGPRPAVNHKSLV